MFIFQEERLDLGAVKLTVLFEANRTKAGVVILVGNKISYFEIDKSNRDKSLGKNLMSELLRSHPYIKYMSVDNMNIPMQKIALRYGFRVYGVTPLTGSVENKVYLDFERMCLADTYINTMNFERDID